ncbi:hypothetical protein J2Y03_005254 [Neobacillus niacini]|uniref:hypothetical protein n=1 Tax=Neobacillus niacini TaxID=86668 RepID=UPI0028633CD8|nr:hypothetical protein [Neobacillus niacini]MDR7080194.1 hypothetical protein [Neobacillus niacini]
MTDYSQIMYRGSYEFGNHPDGFAIIIWDENGGPEADDYLDFYKEVRAIGLYFQRKVEEYRQYIISIRKLNIIYFLKDRVWFELDQAFSFCCYIPSERMRSLLEDRAEFKI